MEDILNKEIICFLCIFGKFTNGLDFNPSTLCSIVKDYLIKERMVNRYDSKRWIKLTTYWVSGNFEVIHSYNGQPAIIHNDGSKEWYKNGKLHRDNDQPAIIYGDGNKEWYKNGILHRDNDQPAVIDIDGTQEWYKNGKLHRDNDRPVIIQSNGDVYYDKGLFLIKVTKK